MYLIVMDNMAIFSVEIVKSTSTDQRFEIVKWFKRIFIVEKKQFNKKHNMRNVLQINFLKQFSLDAK